MLRMNGRKDNFSINKENIKLFENKINFLAVTRAQPTLMLLMNV